MRLVQSSMNYCMSATSLTALGQQRPLDGFVRCSSDAQHLLKMSVQGIMNLEQATHQYKRVSIVEVF